MRGEETQIAGLLAVDAAFDGIACLPGTHSKWVHIGAGKIRSFQTFLTGELFALLAGGSVLRHAMTDEGWDGSAFLEAVDETAAAPESIAAKLFSIRAESLLHALPGATARARLSGYLIGLELVAAKPCWQGESEPGADRKQSPLPIVFVSP